MFVDRIERIKLEPRRGGMYGAIQLLDEKRKEDKC
jgi:hypothetical protein